MGMTLRPPQPAVVVRPETSPEAAFDPSLSPPAREREGMLPPPDGLPPAARAVDIMNAAAAMPDVRARAQMSIALQRNVGNARMAAMLHTIPEPQPPPPAPTQKEVAPARPTMPVPLLSPAAVTPPSVAQAPAKPAAATPSPPRPAPSATTETRAAEAAATVAKAPTPDAAPPATSTPAIAAASPKAPSPSTAAPKLPVPVDKVAVGTAAREEEPQAAAEAAAGEPAKAAPSAKDGATTPIARTGKAASGKAGAAVEGGGEEGGEPSQGAAGGGAAVTLKMPEPPADVTPAARQRIRKVQSAAGQATAAHTNLPPAEAATGQARDAVTEPTEETNARAEANLVTALGQRPKPSPQIEELCKKIHDVIESKRPPDKASLVKAKPEEMARAAGDVTKRDVEGDVKSVDQSYDTLDKPPAGKQEQKGQPLEVPPENVSTPPVNATQATPDAVPAENVSLDADVEDNKARMAEAGMESKPAKLAQTGPVAEARAAQGELEQTAQADPAKVLAEQKSSLAKANADMAALQQKALGALSGSRRKTVAGTTGQQKKMVGSEEQMRTAASTQSRAIFSKAQTQVNGLLQTLPQTAMKQWDDGVKVASLEFKQELKVVADWIEERHSGVFGSTVVSFVDWAGFLPPSVKLAYDQAEKKFGNTVCDIARKISTLVNGIILSCEAIIADARAQIAALFAELPKSLQGWAAEEQAKLGAQLDSLNKHAHEVRDNFDKELVSRASQSVQEVREQIHELRQKAGGLVGRIADAINSFLDDPAKFIIEALLDVLSIPRAAFWAVVAKIKKVIGDIADDPEKFANNLMKAVSKGFSQFFDNIGDHLIHGFIDWLTGGLAAAGVELPKDLSVKSIVTFFLQLMGITWPRIRKLLAKHVGEENVALLEKAYSIVANLIALGPEGIFEMIKEKLNPQEILDQIINAAVDYMTKAVIKAVSARILLLFNPVGAILQAIEAIYKVLKWIFTNAARIFKLIETIVDGIADIIAGNIGGMANAVEKALAGLIAPVIDFLADYLGFGDLPDKVRDTILGFQAWVEGILDQVIGWLVEKGKALLAAVGLGGKEEKGKEKKAGEVGKTVTFSAAGKGHKLWIEVKGTGAELMVASADPGPVEKRLAGWESRIEQAGERKAEAQAAIASARQFLSAAQQDAQQALQLKDQVKSAPENAEAGSKFEQADQKTEAEEETLGATLKTLFEIFGELKMKPAEITFLRRKEYDAAEYRSQLDGQQEGLNRMKVEQWFKNREAYLRRAEESESGSGRATEGAKAQKVFRMQERERLMAKKVVEEKKTREQAAVEVDEFMKTQAALHDPDQIAGGDPTVIRALGNRRINSSIGNQWKYGVGTLDDAVKAVPEEIRKDVNMNVVLLMKDR